MTPFSSATIEKISKQEADIPSAKDFVFFLTHHIQTDHKWLYCILLCQIPFLSSHWRNILAYDKITSSEHLRLRITSNVNCSEIFHNHNNNIWKYNEFTIQFKKAKENFPINIILWAAKKKSSKKLKKFFMWFSLTIPECILELYCFA